MIVHKRFWLPFFVLFLFVIPIYLGAVHIKVTQDTEREYYGYLRSGAKKYELEHIEEMVLASRDGIDALGLKPADVADPIFPSERVRVQHVIDTLDSIIQRIEYARQWRNEHDMNETTFTDVYNTMVQNIRNEVKDSANDDLIYWALIYKRSPFAYYGIIIPVFIWIVPLLILFHDCEVQYDKKWLCR